MNVLINLHRGYGLGDCVQMSSVLRHVKKYRTEWKVEYCAEEGKYQVGRGIAANAFSYEDLDQRKTYDAAVDICLYDTFANWGDRPSTRVSSTLHERFGLDWDRECGRYQVNVSDEAMKSARVLLSKGQGRLVAIHYKGDSARNKKNLTDSQVLRLCETIINLRYTPIILDWRRSCPIIEAWRLCSPQEWGGNAEMVCAVISQCQAFVGIDSGPSKCAAATDTPSMVVWTGHHPAEFYDPAPNVTHLVPEGYHGLYPVCDNKGVVEFFEENYNVTKYKNDPVVQINTWLRETLTG